MFKIIFCWKGNSRSRHTSALRAQGGCMPYPSTHRPAVKKNIIESARKLFNRHGFECVSIHQILPGFGLTHGGFCWYFHCKIDLYAAGLNSFFTVPNWKCVCECC